MGLRDWEMKKHPVVLCQLEGANDLSFCANLCVGNLGLNQDQH